MELPESQLNKIADGWSVIPTSIACKNCGREVACEDAGRWAYCTGCGHKNGPFATS